MWSLLLWDVSLAEVKGGLGMYRNTQVLNSGVKFFHLLFALLFKDGSAGVASTYYIQILIIIFLKVFLKNM